MSRKQPKFIGASLLSELDASLESNHPRRTVSAQANAQQTGGRRDRAFERAEFRRDKNSREAGFD